MEQNPAFRKASALLLHPASLTAVALLLINDHLLRRLWPSWLTGKLGDFAWLFFFPFAAAVLVALVLPRRLPNRERWVALLAFSLVGGIFALVKTAPAAHRAAISLAEAVLGFPVGWRRDPGDLLALSSLLGSWVLWRRTSTPQYPRAGWGFLFSLALLATAANSGQPDVGLFCIQAQDNRLLAFSTYSRYESSDGGLTWQPAGPGGSSSCTQPDPSDEHATKILLDPLQPGIQYRYTPGGGIERSTDEGESWQLDYSLAPATQAERALYSRSKYNPAYLEPPLDGQVDPATGSVVFAMGYAGILVREPDGTYTWVEAGPYRRVQARSFQALSQLLVGEIWLGLEFGLLGMITLTWKMSSSTVRKIVIVLAWLAWAFAAFMLTPALSSGAYGAGLSALATIAAGVLAVPLGIDALLRAGARGSGAAAQLLLALVVSALAFILPYFLWGLNLIQAYQLAALLGLLLGCLALFLAYHRLGRAGAMVLS